jgi:FeS assembly SUF system regulator
MIRLTKLTDYGFVMLTQFARENGNTVKNAPEIASDASVPLPTASKILKILAREGILKAHRGVKGGYRLARPPAEITVADVISALEGPIAITECSDRPHSDCAMEAVCPVRTNWQRINHVVHDALKRISLAELSMSPPEFNKATALPSSFASADGSPPDGDGSSSADDSMNLFRKETA